MIEQVKDLVSIPLSIFESIFATKICNFQNERDTMPILMNLINPFSLF